MSFTQKPSARKKNETKCTSNRQSKSSGKRGARAHVTTHTVDQRTETISVRGDAQNWHSECVRAESHGRTHSKILLGQVQAPSNTWVRGHARMVGVGAVLENSKGRVLAGGDKHKKNCICTQRNVSSWRNGVRVPSTNCFIPSRDQNEWLGTRQSDSLRK